MKQEQPPINTAQKPEKREGEKSYYQKVVAMVGDFINDVRRSLASVADQQIKEMPLDEDAEARKVLEREMCRYIAGGQEIAAEAHECLQAIAKENNIPLYLLEPPYGEIYGELDGEERVPDLTKDLVEKHAAGEKELETFVDDLKNNPDNLLYIDHSLTREQIQSRMEKLAIFYNEYQAANPQKRNEIEKQLVEQFGIKMIPQAAQNYLDTLSQHQATRHSQGAENKNMLFLSSELRPQVIKITKDRHDVDFTSVLKLMYNMHALALRFNHEASGADNVSINVLFDDMVVYRDQQNNYKRMVRQRYAPGQPIKKIPSIVKNSPEYQAAWKTFLQKVNATRETDGFVLDISDSDAGFKESRGDVSQTGNVFVQLPSEQGGQYIFSVIDPDVFDADPSKHKFDPAEYTRKKGGLKGLVSAAKMTAVNTSRERIVSRWQDKYMEEELKK